jgi:hypothetical protein
VSGDGVSAIVRSVYDRRGTPATEEQKANAAQALVKMGDAFVVVAAKDYKADAFTGAQGYASMLALHAKSIKDNTTPEQQEEIAATLAAGAYNHQRVLSAHLTRKLPSLRGRVDIRIDPSTGTLIQKKAGEKYSQAELDLIAQTNSSWGGDKIIRAFTGLTGLKREDAVALINTSGDYVREAQEAATQAAPTRVSTPSGGGNWWESF